jgi:hypothetical protein
VLVVRVAQTGDYSSYTLRLVRSAVDASPPLNFDPRMAEIAFSFKAECPSEFDCRDERVCLDEPETPPEIDYLARDYASFRRLLLDRLAQQVPTWRESSAADLGITLVELLAYVGDHLSYRQDAIATEAYLNTARKRISLRRHAQLVDYAMHDGCNARCFVQLQLDAAVAQLALPAAGTRFLTRCDRAPVAIATNSRDEAEATAQQPVVFEPVHDLVLFRDHNVSNFHTWGDDRCCLPKGVTRATLRGAHPDLRPGDWLLFEEVLGPITGQPGDADPTHRQVVRLTRLWAASDPLPNPALDLTEIEWAAADALRFPLCLSSVSDEAHGAQPLSDVSVARGNVVLADHGRTMPAEDLGKVPAPRLFVPNRDRSHCGPRERIAVPVRYRPALVDGPVTQRVEPRLDDSAAVALRNDVAAALPQITLSSTPPPGGLTWTPRRSLLDSDALAREFVVEVEQDGTATLRFGDDTYGRRPERDTAFTAIYRVGNGTAGNIGAEGLAHIVSVDVSAITAVRNPLPASGGVEAESTDSVRRRAPEAFRTQERAVTPADYGAKTQLYSGVQRAAGRMRWTGSWHTMFVTVDREGGAPLDGDTRAGLTRHLDRYRMAGHDVEFEEPVHVSLSIAMHICVAPDFFRSDVRARLIDLFSNRMLPDGRRGLFHPDNLSFGQTVWLSPLIAAAHDVPGVESLEVRMFGRQADNDPGPIEDGRLLLGQREIARLDNDPNYPEHGSLTLELHGGK